MKTNKNIFSLILLFYLGILSLIIQMIFIRLAASVFFGNEIFIGVFIAFWLIGTGIGSIYISKLTKHIFYIGALTGLGRLALNLLLIPTFGIVGAGAASALAAVGTVMATYLVAHRVHPIRYDLSGIPRTAIVCLACFAAVSFLPDGNAWILLPVKLTLAGAFVLIAMPRGLFHNMRKAAGWLRNPAGAIVTPSDSQPDGPPL